MTLRRTLDVMAATVSRASSIPLSASCLVNRAELLSLVERAKAELPAELDEAAALLVAHQEVIDAAERDRDQLLADARDQVEDLLAESAVVAGASARAEQILDAARAEAARLLREADDYCDGKLADFEADLQRLTGQVRRGRDRLRQRSDLGAPTSEGAGEMPFDGEARDTLATFSGSDEREGPLPQQAGPGRVIDLTAVEEGADLSRPAGLSAARDPADLGSR